MYTRTSFPPALLRKRGRKWREANTRCRTLAFYDTARLRRVRVIASGIALPLMAVVLGSLTTTFTNLASGQVDSLFQRRVNLIYLAPGTIEARLSFDMKVIQEGISKQVGVVLSSLSTLITAIIIAFVKDWRLALVVYTILPAIVIFTSLTS
ncbi:hypothetical protein V2W45_1343965 [Cenococcum geophilum]